MPGDEFAAASGGQLAGTRSLQQSIDALTQSNNQLKGAIQQNAAAASGGLVTKPAQAQGTGQTFTSGSFPSANGGYQSGQYTASFVGFPNSSPSALSTPGNFPTTNGGYQTDKYVYQGGSSGPPTQYSNEVAVPQPNQVASFGNLPNGGRTDLAISSPSPMATGGNGGYGSGGAGAGGTGGYGYTSLNGPNGGEGSGSGVGLFSKLGSVITGAVGGMAAQGSADLGPQTSLNSAYQQAMLGTAPGTKNAYSTIYTQMAGWGNTKPNAVSTSAADAAQGFLTLGNLAGTPGNLNATPLGKAAQSAWAGAGVLSPGLGSAGAANIASAIYNPVTSQNMYMMGYGTTPLAPRGSNRGPASMAQITQGMFQKWFGGNGAPSSQQLAASMAPGQTGYLNTQALGLNPQAMTPILEGYDKLFQQGVSADQANKLFQQAANGNNLSDINAAQNKLQSYGIPKSDFQTIKNLQSQQTARQSETSQGFTQGLNDAASALEKFNSALNSILNGPLGNAYGMGKGLAAGGGLPGSPLNSPLVGGIGGGLLGSLLGHGAGGAASGLFKGLFSKLFGGGGGAAGGAAGDAAAGAEGAAAGGAAKIIPGEVIGSSTATGAAGAAGASGAGGAAAGIGLGTLASGAALSAGMSSLSNSIYKSTNKDANTGAGQDQSQWGVGHKLSQTLHDASLTNPAGWSHLPSDVLNDAGVNTSFLKKLNPFHYLGFQAGGRVQQGSSQAGADDVPAMLSKDEAVLNKGAAQALGYDAIDSLNKKYANGQKTQVKKGVLYAAGGAALLSDAKKYKGHRYVYGGPSNPQQGWDCSSFASYVIGHDQGMQLPGGSWASTTNSGKAHGDVASQFLSLPGAHKVSSDPADIQPGDVLVWKTHVGFGVGPGTMFSAYDTASGTIQTAKDMKNAGGPSGETLTIMRYGGGGGSKTPTSGKGSSGPTSGSGNGSGSDSGSNGSGSNSGSNGASSTSGTKSFGLSGGGGGLGLDVGSYGSSDEVSNVQSALLGGIGGGGGFAGFQKQSSNGGSNTSPPSGGGGSSTPSSGGKGSAVPSSGGKGTSGKGGKATPVGNVKAGNISTPTQFAQELLKALGAPQTSANISSLVNWEAAEGGNWNNKAAYNPLNTTMQEPGSTKMGNNNAGVNGVQAYTSWSEGLKATVATLENGSYPNIVSLLKAGKGLKSGAASDFATWGTLIQGAATGGQILVGERGPELMTVNGQSSNVMDAAKTHSLLKGTSAQPAHAPWLANTDHAYNYANLPQNSHTPSGHGVNVSLNVSSGAIVIQGGNNSTTDISNAVSQGIKQTVDTLANHQTLQNIANGVK